jgi:hypothetical protein
VASVLLNNNWTGDIIGALIVPVLIQYIDVWQRLQLVQTMSGSSNTFSWQWESSGQYSCRSTYRAHCSGQVQAPCKCIFFMWLTILGRCWTSEYCHHHGFLNLPDYALCTQALEHIDHLLLGYPFSRQVWFLALGCYKWRDQALTSSVPIASWWLRARKQIAKARCEAFDSTVACI